MGLASLSDTGRESIALQWMWEIQNEGGIVIASYIVFFGLTEKGMQNIKESPARVEAAKQTFRDMGAEVKAFYAVMGMGQYDTMFVVEAPNDQTVAKAALTVGSLGNVRTDTHRALTEDEYRKIVDALP